MSIQITQELCDGCGECVISCPSEAIRLVDQHASIIETLCTGCEACIAACPNEAIFIQFQPEPENMIITQPVIESPVTPPDQNMVLSGESSPGTGIKPLAGVVLTYLGTEIVPRLVDALGRALEQKISQPKTSVAYQPPPTSSNATPSRRGKKVRRRYRGGSEN